MGSNTCVKVALQAENVRLIALLKFHGIEWRHPAGFHHRKRDQFSGLPANEGGHRYLRCRLRLGRIPPARGRWLNDCTVYYWGDIDTHGFAILNQLRGQFAHVVSFLMDSETLHAHTAIWGVEDKPSLMDLHRLTADERALYDDLRDNRIRKGLRLEQEQIGFGWVGQRLQELLRDTDRAKPTSL